MSLQKIKYHLYGDIVGSVHEVPQNMRDIV
jgi:hypothetical protein